MILSSKVFKNTKFFGSTLTENQKIYWAQRCIIPQTFVGIDYLINYIGLKLFQPLQDLVRFYHYFFNLLSFFCSTEKDSVFIQGKTVSEKPYSCIFYAVGVFNPSLYASFILSINLLLILLI